MALSSAWAFGGEGVAGRWAVLVTWKLPVDASGGCRGSHGGPQAACLPSYLLDVL